VNQRSPYYNERSKASIFYAESWALIHYLMLGEKGIHRRALFDYLNALGQGSSPQEAAAEAFGSLKDLEGRLEQYIRGAYFLYVSVPAPPKMPGSEVAVRVLPDAEADGYRGSFLAMHGQYRDAQALVDEGRRLDSKAARVQQAQAAIDYFQDRQAQALDALNAALAIDSNDALTHYMRAELSYRSAGEQPAQENKAGIEEDLRRAIAISPEFTAAYGLLSVCVMTDEGGLIESFNLAKKAESLEPGNTRYQFVMAQVLARMRRYDDAETIALRVLANASEQQEQEEVNRFLEFVRKARSAPLPNNRQQPLNPVASVGPN
jgi:tetratricopeptide (TPR) repeat protein